MANFTAADVKKLRDLTAAGMMDCKKALEEADGDFDKAVELLRIKGAKDVGKRAGRTTANGLVAHHGTGLVELNCETDFVAKNEAFIALGDKLAQQVDASKPADVDALLASKLGDTTVADLIQVESARIGEKLVINRIAVLGEPVAVYMHRKSPDLPPQVGVAVEFSGKEDEAGLADARSQEIAHDVALHIASAAPQYVTRDDVPADVVEKERTVLEELTRNEGKPEQALPKIVEGRLNGFYKNTVLVEQPFVRDPKTTVGKLVGELGKDAAIRRFVRIQVGAE